MAAIAPALLTKGGTDTDARDYSTASITPTAGRTVLAAIQTLDLGANNATPTCSGCGLTWTLVKHTGGGAGEPRLDVFSATATSPTTGAVTFTGVVGVGQTADGAAWMVVEVANADTTAGTDGIIQSDSDAVAADNWTGGGLVLGAFRDAGSGTCFFQAAYDNAGGVMTNSAGAGFTELDEIDQSAGGDSLALSFNYATGNVTQAVGSASAANDKLLGVMMEVGRARVALDGTGSSAGSATGALSATRPISGSGTAADGASGSLARARPLDAKATAADSASGTLSAARALTATAIAAGSASGSAVVARALTANAGTASSAAGTLSRARPLDATASAASSATGELSVTRSFTATAPSSASASGNLAATRGLDGTASAAAGATADLAVISGVALTGTASTASGATGTLSITRSLAGIAPSAASASGLFTRTVPYVATASAASEASGDLSVLSGAQAAHDRLMRGIVATLPVEEDRKPFLVGARPRGLVVLPDQELWWGESE